MSWQIKLGMILLITVFSILLFISSEILSLDFISSHFSQDQVLVPEIENFILGINCYLKFSAILGIVILPLIWCKRLFFKWHLILLITSLTILGFYLILFWDHTIDDLFISLRYAQNLLATGQLVWNAGELPVEGFSNPLWIFIAVGVMLLKLPPVIIMKIIGILAGILMIVVAFFTAKNFKPQNKYLPYLYAAMICLTPFYAYWFVSGLETGLYLLLFITAILLLLKMHNKEKVPVMLIPALIMLTLIRPEGAGLTIFSIFMLKNHTQRKYLLLFPIIFILCLFICRYLYFGNLLPLTVYTKSKLGGGVIYIGAYLRFLLPFVPFFIIGIWDENRQKSIVLILVLLGYTFYLLNSTAAQGGRFRFLLSSMLIFYLFTSLGFTKTINYLKHHPVDLWKKSISIFIILFIFLYLTASNACSIRELTKRYNKGHVEGHVALAQWLLENYPTSTTIALVDCGYIPYRTGFKTYDLFGLNDPYIARNGMDINYLRSLQPDLFILASLDSSEFQPRFAVDKVLYPDSQFQNQYRFVKMFDRYYYFLWVFKRNDL